MKCKFCGGTGSPIEHMEYCRERRDAIARQKALSDALAAVEGIRRLPVNQYDANYDGGVADSMRAIRRLMAESEES